MKLLAIDTAAELCAASVYETEDGRELGRKVVDIGKGHAEALMGVIADALDAAGTDYAGLGGIAVCVGPGSFTGVRIGVATARGLALALKIPSVGITTLAAFAFEARAALPARAVLAVLDARRDELYAALYDGGGTEIVAPHVTQAIAAAALAARHDAILTGSGADIVAGALEGRAFAIAGRKRTADISAYAMLAARQGFGGGKPKPLYLRGADARPQEGFALPRRTA